MKYSDTSRGRKRKGASRVSSWVFEFALTCMHFFFFFRCESQSVGSGTTMASHCAKTRSVLVAKTPSDADARFPEGVKNVDGDHHVLVHPLISSKDGQLIGLVELLRGASEEPFGDSDVATVNAYLVWAEVALDYAMMCISVNKQKDLKNFLLNVVK